MDKETLYDLAIIGGGPAGYVGAIRAAQNGLKVLLIEKENLGGICLNWGCIPTKALLRSAEVLHLMGHASNYGLHSVVPLDHKNPFDLQTIIKRSRDVSAQLTKGVQHLMKKNKVPVIKGTARLAHKKQEAWVLSVTTPEGVQEIHAKNVMMATGARARTLPHLQPDGHHIWTYKEAMTPDTLPKRLLVVGSGAIGIEFASFYRRLGCDVTVVERETRILPAEDAEISALAHKAFEKEGIHFHLGCSVENLVAQDGNVVATLSSQQNTQSFDKAILAMGVVGNTEDLGLEDVGIHVQNNAIPVDAYGATTLKGLYAVGDVAGAPWLAHKASHEAITVADLVAGKPAHPLIKKQIPGCTYATPQVASIGLREDQVKAQDIPHKVGRFPFMGNGKALAMGEPEGLVKVIFHKETGELLGAHMIGAEVTEMIQGFAIAMACEATEETLKQTIFPHPTLSEMMHEAVLDADGACLHM